MEYGSTGTPYAGWHGKKAAALSLYKNQTSTIFVVSRVDGKSVSN